MHLLCSGKMAATRYPSVFERFHFFIWLICMACLVACGGRKPIAKTNLAYRYDVTFPVEENHLVINRDDDLDVYIQLDFKKLGKMDNPRLIWDKYAVWYSLVDGYQKRINKITDTLGFENRVAPSGNPITFFLKVSKSSVRNQLLVVSVKDRVTNEITDFDIPVQNQEMALSQSYVLFHINGKLPVYSPYILTGDSVLLRHFGGSGDSAYCQFHAFNSSVALPPMAAIPTSGHDFDKFDRMALPLRKILVFRQPGYYYFPPEGAGQTGFGFMVIEPAYPRVTQPLDLIDPMIYISTREERKNLLEASNRKLALDQFWLKVNNQKDESRKVIKAYFENIEAANHLFAGHKSGWRTDRGMVMAIYGPPELVYRNWDSEVWQYPKSNRAEAPAFYFSRRNLPNGVPVWEMKRYEEYDRIWYGRVELWRKGIINP